MMIWHNARLLRWIASWMMLAAIGLIVLSCARWIVDRAFFNIVKIEVVAIPGVPLQQIDSTVLTTVQLGELKGGLFRADLAKVKRAFESTPWVRRANVRRVWPNRLQVEVEEHRAMALWDDGRIVNTFGELFTANSAALENESELPNLSGPQGTHAEVTKRWQEITEWVAPLSRRVIDLTLSERHAWQVELDDGMVLLLGRDQGTQIKERFVRMVQVLPEVQQRLGRAAVQIDLRHPEGFAIKAPRIDRVSSSGANNSTNSNQAPVDEPSVNNRPTKSSSKKQQG
jgi:cell division protein FtsQ